MTNEFSRMGVNPARGQLNRENESPLSPFARENLISRDGFSRPVPQSARSFSTLMLNRRVGEPDAEKIVCHYARY